MTASQPSSRRFSVAQLALLVPLVALIIDAWVPIGDNSFLWHIRAGGLQAEASRVLTEDPFSFTRGGEPWLTQSWLVELLYHRLEVWTGLGFVPLMLLSVSTLTFAGVGLVAYKRSRSVSTTAVVLLMTTFLIVSFLVPRPVLFSYALFVLVVLAWEHPRTRWVVPFLFWVWASAHGSFAVGLAYIGLNVLSRRDWRAMPNVAVSAAVTLATAHGLGVVTMLLGFAEAGDTLRLLTEWRRPELLSAVFTPFLIGVGIIFFGALRGRIRTSDLWVIAPFIALGFTSTRAVPTAWIGLIPYVAAALGPVKVGSVRLIRRPAAVTMAALVIVVPLLLRGDGSLNEVRFPVAAADALLDANTFHDDRVGGFLIWRDGPERQVFLDDRAELYGERMAEFVAIRDLEAPWQPVFERDGITQVLMGVDELLVEELTGSGWSVEYADEHYVVLR